MSIWRNDPTTGELVAYSNPLQLLVIVPVVAVIAAALILKVNMHTLLNPVVLDRATLAFTVLALAFALLNLRVGRGRVVGYAGLLGAVLVSWVSAYLAWNGHDWISDDRNSVRLTAVGLGVVALVLLRVAARKRKSTLNV